MNIANKGVSVDNVIAADSADRLQTAVEECYEEALQ